MAANKLRLLHRGVPQANKSRLLQWGSPQANELQLKSSPVVPTGVDGKAIAANYEDPALNVANQNLLGEQNGLTDPLVNNTLQTEGLGGYDGDMLDFGLAAVSTVAGMYYQNEMLDQGQQSLDFANTQYRDMRADKTALNDANKERAATSLAQQNA